MVEVHSAYLNSLLFIKLAARKAGQRFYRLLGVLPLSMQYKRVTPRYS